MCDGQKYSIEKELLISYFLQIETIISNLKKDVDNLIFPRKRTLNNNKSHHFNESLTLNLPLSQFRAQNQSIGSWNSASLTLTLELNKRMFRWKHSQMSTLKSELKPCEMEGLKSGTGTHHSPSQEQRPSSLQRTVT